MGIRCEVERVGRKMGGVGGLKVKEVNRKLGSFEKSLEAAGCEPMQSGGHFL